MKPVHFAQMASISRTLPRYFVNIVELLSKRMLVTVRSWANFRLLFAAAGAIFFSRVYRDANQRFDNFAATEETAGAALKVEFRASGHSDPTNVDREITSHSNGVPDHQLPRINVSLVSPIGTGVYLRGRLCGTRYRLCELSPRLLRTALAQAAQINY